MQMENANQENTSELSWEMNSKRSQTSIRFSKQSVSVSLIQANSVKLVKSISFLFFFGKKKEERLNFRFNLSPQLTQEEILIWQTLPALLNAVCADWEALAEQQNWYGLHSLADQHCPDWMHPGRLQVSATMDNWIMNMDPDAGRMSSDSEVGSLPVVLSLPLSHEKGAAKQRRQRHVQDISFFPSFTYLLLPKSEHEYQHRMCKILPLHIQQNVSLTGVEIRRMVKRREHFRCK